MVRSICRALAFAAALALSSAAVAAPGVGAQAPVLTDPETGDRYLEVRPDSELERGRVSVAPWVVWTVSGVAVLLAAAFLIRRATGSRAD